MHTAPDCKAQRRVLRGLFPHSFIRLRQRYHFSVFRESLIPGWYSAGWITAAVETSLSGKRGGGGREEGVGEELKEMWLEYRCKNNLLESALLSTLLDVYRGRVISCFDVWNYYLNWHHFCSFLGYTCCLESQSAWRSSVCSVKAGIVACTLIVCRISSESVPHLCFKDVVRSTIGGFWRTQKNNTSNNSAKLILNGEVCFLRLKGILNSKFDPKVGKNGG